MFWQPRQGQFNGSSDAFGLNLPQLVVNISEQNKGGGMTVFKQTEIACITRKTIKTFSILLTFTKYYNFLLILNFNINQGPKLQSPAPVTQEPQRD